MTAWSAWRALIDIVWGPNGPLAWFKNAGDEALLQQLWGRGGAQAALEAFKVTVSKQVPLSLIVRYLTRTSLPNLLRWNNPGDIVRLRSLLALRSLAVRTALPVAGTLGGTALLVTALSTPLGNGDLPAGLQSEIDGFRRNQEIVRSETMAHSDHTARSSVSNQNADSSVSRTSGSLKTEVDPSTSGVYGSANLPLTRPEFYRPMPVYEPVRPLPVPKYEVVQPLPRYEVVQPLPRYEVVQPLPRYEVVQPLPRYETVQTQEHVEPEPKKSKGQKILEGIAIGVTIGAPIVQGIVNARQAEKSAAASPDGLCENPAYAPAYAKWLQDVQKGQAGKYVTDPNTPDNRIVARFIPCPK